MPRGKRGTVAPHGTLTRYTYHGCRCELCLDATRTYYKSRGRKGRSMEQYLTEVLCHGISAYKKRGCRCDVCRAAAAAEKRRWRQSHPEARKAENTKRMERHRATRNAA